MEIRSVKTTSNVTSPRSSAVAMRDPRFVVVTPVHRF
jgi:hypothetical protein